MKFSAMFALAVLSGSAIADIFPVGDQDYKCQTRGGFFDFSPNRAIAACREEVDAFCKSKGAPPIIGKINGEPSGPARYAKAEINFQCMSEADVALKQKQIVEARSQQVRIEIENSKLICQQDFGFVPNTPEFSNCLLELQKQNFANNRSAQELAAQKDIADAQLAQKRQSEADQATMSAIQSVNKVLATPPVVIAPRPTVDTKCTSNGSQVSCTSTQR